MYDIYVPRYHDKPTAGPGPCTSSKKQKAVEFCVEHSAAQSGPKNKKKPPEDLNDTTYYIISYDSTGNSWGTTKRIKSINTSIISILIVIVS